jgi:hypothetical protein
MRHNVGNKLFAAKIRINKTRTPQSRALLKNIMAAQLVKRRSKQAAAGHYPEPDETGPRPPTLFL